MAKTRFNIGDELLYIRDNEEWLSMIRIYVIGLPNTDYEYKLAYQYLNSWGELVKRDNSFPKNFVERDFVIKSTIAKVLYGKV